MTSTPRRRQESRPSLSRARVLEGAVRVADERGVTAVSMRKVAEELGVEAMSLYHHVTGKDEILDGIVDLVFAEIELPRDETDWRAAMRRRASSARAALLRHTWALGLMDSRRTPGPATLTHHDWMIGRLREAGFSLPRTAQAVSALDGYVYGFVLQESSLPFRTPEELEGVATAMVDAFPAGGYPHLTEMIQAHALSPGYDYAEEFLPGLDLILDGLERLLHGSEEPSRGLVGPNGAPERAGATPDAAHEDSRGAGTPSARDVEERPSAPRTGRGGEGQGR